MWIPLIFLAVCCIFSGVFATNLVVPELFMPVTGAFQFTGFWNSSFVSLLVLISICLGIILYLALNLKRFRTEDSFIGGEKFRSRPVIPPLNFIRLSENSGFSNGSIKKQKKNGLTFTTCQNILFSGSAIGSVRLIPEFCPDIFSGFLQD